MRHTEYLCYITPNHRGLDEMQNKRFLLLTQEQIDVNLLLYHLLSTNK